MMTVTNLDATPAGSTLLSPPKAVPAILLGDSDVYVCPWIATYKRRAFGNQLAPLRNADTCFMRGLKERIRIQSNSGLTWKWRRVTFTSKGPAFYTDAPSGTLFYDTWPNVGNVRVLSQTDSLWRSRMDQILFKGSFGRDYRSYMDAVIDRDVITVKSDVTRTIASGNAQGVWKTYDIWHPMNSNLVYSDDEAGDGMTTSGFSTSSKMGMGDYYVIDFFQPSLTGAAADRLLVDMTSTIYWHEK